MVYIRIKNRCVRALYREDKGKVIGVIGII